MSAPGDTREGWQQLDHRQPGNYESQRGPAPRQEGPLVGEGEAGIRFGIPGSLRGSPLGSLAAPGASGGSAPMIFMAVTRLSLLMASRMEYGEVDASRPVDIVPRVLLSRRICPSPAL
jgi:hypothetical protein